MAKKRKTSQVEPSVAASERMPDRAAEIRQRFSELCRQAGLHIAIDGVPTPNQLQHGKGEKLWHLYKFLSWKNDDYLRSELDTFLKNLRDDPQSHSEDNRANRLLDCLEGCRAVTPKSERFVKFPRRELELPAIPEPTQPCSTQEVFQAPSSPTPAPVKLAGQQNLAAKFKVTKAGAGISPTSHKPTAHTPVSAKREPTSFSAQKVQSKLSFDRLGKNPLQYGPASKPVIPDASFTKSFTSTSGNTSFDQNRSFWSNPGGQESFRTDATSFSDYTQPPARIRDQDSLGASSLSSGTAEEWIRFANHVESSQDSATTDKTIRPRQAHSAGVNVSSEDPSITTNTREPSTSRRRTPLDDYAYLERTSDFYGSSIGTSTLLEWEELDQSVGQIGDHVMIDSFPDEQLKAEEARSAAYAALENKYPPTSSKESLLDLSDFQSFTGSEFSARWEAARLLQTGHITPDALDAQWQPQDLESLYNLVTAQNMPFQKSPLLKGLKSWETLTRTARLEWTGVKNSHLCRLGLLPTRKDISCSLQRRLGADRVLYIDMPDMSKPPKVHKDRAIQSCLRKWLSTPQELLGRVWYPFFLQPNKKKSTGEGGHSTSVYRLVLVSPSHGMSLCDLMEWCLPYDHNQHQAARKAYMRIELLLSRTIPALVLRPDEIARVNDQLATPEEDDHRFDDPALRFQFYETYEPDMVMGDGCSWMSYWIAYQYAKKLALKRVPSTLQIRVAGAKGLWYVGEPPLGNMDQRPQGPLLSLAPSQVKVHRDTFHGCEEEILSVNVVKANPGARPSLLHMGFLPILLDRGVPLENMCELVHGVVTRQTEEFLEALEAGSVELRQWISRHNEFFEARRREAGIDLLAGFPRALEERIIRMLEAGFEAKNNKYLAASVKLLAANYFQLKNKSFKIELPKSTTLWGIAEPSSHHMKGIVDPSGSLKPGEVCVVFEEAFDAGLGNRVTLLNDVNLLVARNPALGPSDIQKVRAVFKPHLAKYAGTIIFSARGKRPLANKLQGGDYDGDSFWFTWEPLLTEPFKNAPSPWKPPEPEALCITRDRSKLSDHVSDPTSEQQWRKYLATMAEKRIEPSMLGIVTLFHERLVYAGRPIGSSEVMDFVHLHDYLVDADKQGFDFSQADFEAFKKSRKLPPNLPEPKYWQFTKADDKMQQQDESRGRVINPDPGTVNIIDTIFFDVLQPVIESTLKRAAIILDSAASYDHDLASFWNETFESMSRSSVPAAELLKLKDGLREVQKEWATNSRKYPTWPECIQALRSMYDAIQPMNPTDPIVKEWMRKVGKGYSRWDELKASCLAKHHFASGSHPGSFVMNVAGAEMCHLKLARTVGQTSRSMTEEQYRLLKLRRVRAVDSGDSFNDGEDAAAAEDTGYY
ncbi:putative RNA-dependent RNA polymerase SHL2 [Cercospora beticola]|uniref:RNA-dependent RNA polymerase n=1 Tax=Cercospora beticola TaxID=122368 RepID=A0A2G5I4Z7_CERBT|nr:putative RNA-dependent RNA polymerase SHL2 [Cercospora beticola]PIA99875.1 putative RNA-dependent RNA polymerase SHL2 [Cercospora beticola]WPA99852.1 hypothetical protein RHO25_004472 [Cercospora beticola]CAK1361982.1 unnamed protein product [Cercospora beticola]